jgi:hypothetical protein
MVSSKVTASTRSDLRRHKITNSIDSSHSQPQIKQFFKTLNSTQILQKQYDYLQNAFEDFSKRNYEKSSDAVSTATQPTLLEMLNLGTKTRIFNPELKKFAVFVYLRSGRRAYSTLCDNLPLPKVSTICKFINQVGVRIQEGVVRIKELEVFLQTRNLPQHIWLSEDDGYH